MRQRFFSGRALPLRLFAIATASLAVACASSDGSSSSNVSLTPKGETHLNIIGGTTSPASQDATVLITIGSDGLCTGTPRRR